MGGTRLHILHFATLWVSFVGSNPVNFNDPTGHAGCDGDYLGSCVDWSKSLKYPNKPNETLDKGEHSCRIRGDKRLCYSGEMMRELYYYYADYEGDGAWWKEDGGFTIERFLGMMVMYEMGVSPDAKDFMIQAVSLHLWGDARSVGGNGPYCTGACVNGVFNFLAAYAQSAQKRYDAYIRHIDPATGDPNDADPTYDYPIWPGPRNLWSPSEVVKYSNSNSLSIGHDILNPSPGNTIYTGDKAYHWGNYEKAGSNPSMFHFDTFFVFSVNQLNTVQAGGGRLIQVP